MYNREQLRETATKVVSFLNRARTAEEIAGTIRLTGERAIGIKVARNILNKRTQLGEFTNLIQIATIPRIGCDKFCRIVNALVKVEQ